MKFSDLESDTQMAVCGTILAQHLTEKLSEAIGNASEYGQLADEYRTDLAKTRAEVLELKDGTRQLNNFADIQSAKITRLERILAKHGIDIETGEKLPFAK